MVFISFLEEPSLTVEFLFGFGRLCKGLTSSEENRLGRKPPTQKIRVDQPLARQVNDDQTASAAFLVGLYI
jgi:hypothetical protein